METAVTCSLSIAAIGSMAVSGFSHMVAGLRSKKLFQHTKSLTRDAFVHPIDQLVLAAHSKPPLGSRIDCSLNHEAPATRYVVFNGEVLLMGEGPDLDEAAVPVGGATVTPNGRTLHIVPGPLPTLDLIFATDTDAARWAKEVTEASLQDTPGKRIDDLVAYIFDQDKHMRDLQQEVINLRTEHAQVVHERQMVTEIYKQSMDRAKETSLVEKLHASHRKYDRLHERCKHLQEVLLRDGKHVTEEICDNKLLSDHKHHNVHHHHKTHTHPQAPRPDTSKIPDVLKLDSSTSTIGNAFPKCFDVTTTVSNLSPELETPQLEREASSLEGCQSHDVVVDNLRSFEHGGVGSDLTTTAEARLTFPSVSTGCVKFDACQSKSNAQSEMDALAEANLLKQELYQREVAFLAKMNSLEEADAKARRDA